MGAGQSRARDEKLPGVTNFGEIVPRAQQISEGPIPAEAAPPMPRPFARCY